MATDIKPMTDAEKAPSIGRIVHYRLPVGRNAGEYRPAIIVRVWSDTPSPSAAVQLQVFTDCSNDGLDSVYWATSVMHGPGNGQYIWPPYVAPAAKTEEK